MKAEVMKACVCTAMVATLFGASAAEPQKPDPEITAKTEQKARPKRTPAEMAERRRHSMMKSFGGFVRKENSAKGKVVFLNAQKRLPANAFRSAFNVIDTKVHPLWELKDVASVKVANPAADIRAAGGEIGVVLLESDELPALVTAPEAGWAEVNVTALAAKCENDENLAKRVRKEILRAFALIAGGAFMTRDPIVMRGDIRLPQELDLISSATYGIDVVEAMGRGLPRVGVTPWVQETYLRACQEGWAHSPTNEFQQKIWDKIHALPSDPIKIKYDPKRDK